MDINRFGIIEPNNGLPCISSVVVRGNMVYTLGVTGDPVGDVKEQTKQTLEALTAC